MSPIVIVVNESGVTEVVNLSHEFISQLSEMINGSKKTKPRKPRKPVIGLMKKELLSKPG